MKKKLLITGLVIGILLGSFFIFFPRIDLKNPTGEVSKTYTPLVVASNLFFDLSKDVSIQNKVDSKKVGKYFVECKLKYLFFSIKKTFTVTIVDNEMPSITLKGSKEAFVCPGQTYLEEGFEAFDAYDGDLTEKVLIEKTEDTLFYRVSDSSGNTFQTERKLIFEDKENPVITLKGDQTVIIYLGNKYIEPGYSAYDNCDLDLTEKVTVKNNVNTNQIGTYEVEYRVSDSSGHETSVKRVVVVKKRPSSTGDGFIYLTFDDGPSSLTKEVLDILKSEEVKATFFVVSANEYTKRAYQEGHSIGLHSNTHNYKYIYTSSANYFADLKAISDKVYNTIGYRSKLLRFPGGSSNTVSRNYNKGIMSYLTKEVQRQGYTYFDWNVDSNDAGSDLYHSQKIYTNVINHLSHNKTNVVLMHDSGTHKATVQALRDIIHYGKQNGYSFRAITSATPVVVHGVNN